VLSLLDLRDFKFSVVQLGIPFLSDVILADGWFLTLVSPSLSTKAQVLRVLSNTHQFL